MIQLVYNSQSVFRFSLLLHYHTSCSYRVYKSCSYRLFKEAVVRRCFVIKVFLKTSQNSQENTCPRVFFKINLQVSILKKETLVQVLSCEFCKISKTAPFLTEHFRWLLLYSAFNSSRNMIEEQACSVWNLGKKKKKNFGFHETLLAELRLEDKDNYKIPFKYDF